MEKGLPFLEPGCQSILPSSKIGTFALVFVIGSLCLASFSCLIRVRHAGFPPPPFTSRLPCCPFVLAHFALRFTHFSSLFSPHPFVPRKSPKKVHKKTPGIGLPSLAQHPVRADCVSQSGRVPGRVEGPGACTEPKRGVRLRSSFRSSGTNHPPSIVQRNMNLP
jgi:hypothetical protein